MKHHKKRGLHSSKKRPQISEDTIVPVLASIAITVIFASLFVLGLMNFMFYPECSRKTRDCFLVEKLFPETTIEIAGAYD